MHFARPTAPRITPREDLLEKVRHAQRNSPVNAVNVAATWSPAITVRAELPSCARVIVSTSPVTSVTRTISAFVARGCELAGHTVALNGAAGKSSPSPATTARLVPVGGNDGGTTTRLYAKFLWLI